MSCPLIDNLTDGRGMVGLRSRAKLGIKKGEALNHPLFRSQTHFTPGAGRKSHHPQRGNMAVYNGTGKQLTT